MDGDILAQQTNKANHPSHQTAMFLRGIESPDDLPPKKTREERCIEKRREMHRRENIFLYPKNLYPPSSFLRTSILYPKNLYPLFSLLFPPLCGIRFHEARKIIAQLKGLMLLARRFSVYRSSSKMTFYLKV